LNILFGYYNLQHPLRPALSAGLDAFPLYSGHRVFMWNAALRRNLGFLLRVQFDLIVFSTVLLSQHWGGAEHFARVTRRLRDIKRLDAVKIAFPQDEFYCADLYSEFFNELRIDAIYSVAGEATSPHIYRRLNYKPRFYRVLTGYIDERQMYSRPIAHRQYDIGYRTIGKPTPVYGTFGFRKWLIADRFRDACQRRPLAINISTDDRDKFVGDEWYRFLADCKYVLGVESGTSIVDYDGSATRAVHDYLRINPDATFESVVKDCLADADGKLVIRALGPRHLESCLTATCQILVEVEYNGVLKPWKHYIPIKSDFSDIEMVLDIVEKDDRRQDIVTNAWRDIVASGHYNYRSFVSYVLETAMPSGGIHDRSGMRQWRESFAYAWNGVLDGADRFAIRVAIAPWYRLAAILRRLLQRFPVLWSVLLTVRSRLR